VRERPARLGLVRLVGIDGASGSGKTTFAGRLAAAVGPESSYVMHTDAVLDGWAAPESVWPRLREWVLDPLARGEPGAYLAYDWFHARYGNAWHPVPVPEVLILEGTTSAHAALTPELSFAVLVTAEPSVRWQRALVRDGAAIGEPWRAWQVAEEAYFARDRPGDRVDIVVDGAATVGHDPDREFVRLRSAGGARRGGP
jgi:hypothetical protein